jgi:phosphoglycerol transferase
MGHQLYDVYTIKTAKSTGFEDALTNLTIDPERYVTADNITATPGKNIIVLSLESYEKGYLSPGLDLTPNLSKLKNEHTYYHMNQNNGSGWTEASIYTSLTGMPAYFKSPKNETFNNTKIQTIANLGTVLDKAGYDMTYLLAKKEFSGLNDLLSNFGFTVLSNEDYSGNSKDTYWGLHDKDIFEMATEQVLAKKDGDRPFAIFLNTISGHFPEGVYDDRLEGVFQERNSKLEYMTYAVDHFIGELYTTLQKNGLLESTEIFIYPDHEFMGDPVKLIPEFPNERGLFLLTTANEQTLKHNTDTHISQLHIPRLIINGSGIKTNATFLVDYYKEADINDFTEKNINHVLSINEPMTERYTYSNLIDISHKENTVTISQEDGYKTTLRNIKENNLYHVHFDHNDRYSTFKEIDSTKKWWRDANLNLVFSIQGNTVFGSLSKHNMIGVSKHSPETISFTEAEIDIFEDWNKLQPQINKNIDILHLKSVVGDVHKTRGNSFAYTGADTHNLKEGINLLSVQNNVFYVENYNVKDNEAASMTFMERLRKLFPNKIPFVLVIEGGIGDGLRIHKDELQNFGLDELATLNSKTAYISYMNKAGYMIEMTDNHSKYYTSTIYFLEKQYMTEWLIDTTRYIANSGGIIDNAKTTNSLEALNLNYEKGFRYFELDIIETSDGALVAVRDWDFWKKMTGYKGVVPPTLSLFKENKLFDKYTALDIKQIDDWLSKHPDAVLVTGAINDPLKITKAIKDVSRVIVNLDTEVAVIKAQGLGFKDILITNRLLASWGPDKIEKLQEFDITSVTIRHSQLQDNKAMFRNLTENGIKIYVTNVDFEVDKDEKYVFNYDFGLVYGMYANDWVFSTQ